MHRYASLIALAVAAAAVAQERPAPPPPASREAVQPAETNKIVTELAALLEGNYVFPEVGKRYAAMLRSNLASGAYASTTDPIALAERLTKDLQAVSPDGHLGVYLRGYGPGTRMGPPKGPDGKPLPPPASMDGTKWLDDGIAYVNFNYFNPQPQVIEGIRRFMEEHADADTLIIDLRRHTGGAVEPMDAILSYLYAKPTTLIGMDTRESIEKELGTPPAQPMIVDVASPPGIIRREHRVLPHPTEKRLFDAKVYVLTSKATLSAGEHLAFAFKRTGRATLVGETTAGAGHFGFFRPFADRFVAFVPHGRGFDPVTNKDWEGVGVEPDIKVPGDKALDEALRLARANRSKKS